MLASAGVYAAAFVAVVALTGIVRWAAGVERMPRFVGIAFPLGFLPAWAAATAHGWHAFDELGRIGHIVMGAAVIGLALDYWRPPRAFAIAVVAGFAVICAWAEANNGLWPNALDGRFALRFAVLIVAGLGLAWRIDRLAGSDVASGTPAAAAIILLAMLACALATVGAASGMPLLRETGLLAALAMFGFLPWLWTSRAPLPVAMALPAAAALFALAWAIVATAPAALPGVALAALILFADGTARRVPLPKAGISAILYPALLVGMASLPLILAAAVTAVTRSP
jgi:hypothetical protein